MFTQLLTETLLGAFTGYITNDTAIRSLFRPGGVIAQTREEFAQEAGRLLEEQVLTPAVLQQQMMRPEVQSELASAIHAFLQDALPIAFQDLHLCDLPNHEIAVAEVQQILLQFVQSEKIALLHQLKKYFPIESFLTEKQCVQLADQLSQIWKNTIIQQQLAEQIWNSWAHNPEMYSLQSLHLDSLVATLVQNLVEQSVKWQENWKEQYSAQCKDAIRESIKKLNLDAMLLEVDKQMEQATLQQYWHGTEAELVQTLKALLHDPKGQQLIHVTIAEVLKALQTLDIPLHQFISSRQMKDLTVLLQQKLPAVLGPLLDWIWQNSASVQRMLEEAVDEIAQETRGMKGALLQQLKDSFLGEQTQLSDFYHMLREWIASENTIAQIVDFFIQKVEGCKNDTVGQWIAKFNENTTLHTMLYQLIVEGVETYLDEMEAEKVDKLFTWHPGSLSLASHKETVEMILAEVLWSFLEHLDVSSWMMEQKETIKQRITETPVSDFVSEDLLEKGMHYVGKSACKAIPAFATNVSTDQLYDKLYDVMVRYLEENGVSKIEQLCAQVSVSQIIKAIAPIVEQHMLPLREEQIQQGLQLLQGNLSRLAENQIQDLSNADMMRLVEDLMGRELKPLNYLGAGMGALAGATVGVALSATMPELSAVSPGMAVGMLAGKTATFGTVGYTTNCAAVKGLFWPYEPVAGIHTLQGVIPKQKERFAGSMGRLVHQYVLNDTILQQQIDQIRNRMQEQHTADHIAEMSDVVERLFAELAMERKQLATAIYNDLSTTSTDIGKEKLLAFGEKSISDTMQFTTRAQELLESLLPLLEEWTTAQLQKEIPLDQLLSADTLWAWLQDLDLTKVALPDIANLMQQQLQRTCSLQQAIGNQVTQIENVLQVWLTTYLKNTQHQLQIATVIEKWLSKENVFHWILQYGDAWIATHLSTLFRWGEHFLLEFLQSHQTVLVELIEQVMLSRMSFMMQAGYAMMNGRELLEAIVERILHQKLPIFLRLKQKELEPILYETWKKEIVTACVTLRTFWQDCDTASTYKNVLHAMLENTMIQQCVVHTGTNLLQYVADLPICTWGHHWNLRDIFATIQVQLDTQWQTKNKEILACWKLPMQSFMVDFLHQTTLAQLSKGYHGTIPITQIIASFHCEASGKNIFSCFGETIAITKLRDWCDWEQLVETFETDILDCLQQETVQNWMRYDLELLILQFAEVPDKLLPTDSRRVLITGILQALFQVAEAYGSDFLEKMQLSQLTEIRLKQMDSAELERIVRSFANHYLAHIQNRGWMGAIFALPGMLLYFI